jgi:hypothetical protein
LRKEKKMTTTTKSNPRKKYRRKTFAVDTMPGCCGIGVVRNFCDEGATEYSYFGRGGKKNPLRFVTREEQAEACYAQLVQDTHYAQLLISLVSFYRDDNTSQYPELEDVLQREGWTIYSVFINANTGNEVTLYGKYFQDRTYED